MLESAQNLAAAPRSTGSLLPHTWRLTKWELFLTRRRVMSKVLASILLGGYVIVIGFMLISYSVAASRGATDIELSPLRDLLTFPGVLVVGGIYTAQLGPLMACVLAGALVGSEYGYSTQRLAFSRGAGRGQMLAAQAGALALLALGTVGGMLALSALVGVTFGPAIGGSISAPPPGGWTEIVAYWLVLSLVLFAYASLALFFATLGRSVAAGIGLALGLLFVENIVRLILLGVGTVPGAFFQFVGHIPDWFLGVNTTALKAQAGNSPLPFGALDAVSRGSESALPVSHTLPVVLGYCALFLGISYVLLSKRDVTD